MTTYSIVIALEPKPQQLQIFGKDGILVSDILTNPSDIEKIKQQYSHTHTTILVFERQLK